MDGYGATAGIGMLRQDKQTGSLLFPQLPYCPGLTSQASTGFRQTPPPQKVVEFRKGVHLRYGDQEVTAGVAYQVFHQPLLMSFSRIAETALKEVVAPESNEGLLLLGLMSRQCFPYRLRKPVVPDATGHTAEEIEGLLMALEQSLLLLVVGSLKEWNLGKAQPPDKELDGERVALHHHPGFAEVNLGVYARLICQRYEDRTLPDTMLVHVLPDGGLSAGIAMLLEEPVIDTPTRVALLYRLEFVICQPLIDDDNEPTEDRSYPGPG
jgi:hypothetical protein